MDLAAVHELSAWRASTSLPVAFNVKGCAQQRMMHSVEIHLAAETPYDRVHYQVRRGCWLNVYMALNTGDKRATWLVKNEIALLHVDVPSKTQFRPTHADMHHTCVHMHIRTSFRPSPTHTCMHAHTHARMVAHTYNVASVIQSNILCEAFPQTTDYQSMDILACGVRRGLITCQTSLGPPSRICIS